uniref:Uncharacterized protein n=1 Tax=Aegilops tauschii subsp. strangulata TaxID=200361 RepID=A0A453NW45_AEGTS
MTTTPSCCLLRARGSSSMVTLGPQSGTAEASSKAIRCPHNFSSLPLTCSGD